MKHRSILVLALAASNAIAQSDVSLESSAISAGAAGMPDGTVLCLGQPLAGHAMSVQNGIALGAGIIPCMTATCPPDLNNDGVLNFFDLSRFINLFQQQDPAADFNGDGLLNFFDFSAYLLAFNGGCP